MRLLDGFGRLWKYNHIPNYIKELNKHLLDAQFSMDQHRFYGHMKLKNYEFGIDVLIVTNKNGIHRIYTCVSKYGSILEIIFDKKKQCFTIKNLDKLRAEWRKSHSEEDVKDNVFENFIMEVKNL
ncbi:MAG: hypothetical protein AYK22_05875 [Thermoplasmatales archaeon SG8-52-3]|nr:MAG: hypothetical protein AYK22_05875 [Thermoplasmatales archaeon SG8-52-3]